MKTFSDKVILITGATSGIGRSTAIAFAELGASVVVTGRREAEGAETVALVEKAGGKGLFVRTDVSIEADVEAMIAATIAKFGRLDFAFNNAGVNFDVGPITTATSDIIDRTLAINVRGVALCMKHQILAMLASGGGAIVNNASVLGQRPIPGCPIYNASKFAVIGLTKSAALEFAAKGVRVNAVCPAVIDTDMTAEFLNGDPAIRSYMLGLHPVGRFGRAEEIAAAVLYLCGPNSGFVNVLALGVDGGAGI
jgi:NAD(P)-dependent dehydrogenase (short-subunit alcohol dehydrogenase family)